MLLLIVELAAILLCCFCSAGKQVHWTYPQLPWYPAWTSG
jgi:hypothetical protein